MGRNAGKGIEADGGLSRELDVLAIERGAGFFEAAPYFKDIDFGAGAKAGKEKILHKNGFARATAANNNDVVITRLVIEGVPIEELSSTALEK